MLPGGLACIVGGAAVVCGREEGDEVALGEALKAVHDTLVRSHNHLQVVGLHTAHARQTHLAGA